MKIAVFGLGYVGAVSCGCLADLGHTLIGVDVSKDKVDLINRGDSPLVEPGLAEILKRVVKAGRLRATLDPQEAVRDSEAALLCVGTPSTPSGGVNAEYLQTVCGQIGRVLEEHNGDFYVVLNRSTCLPPVHRELQRILCERSGRAIGQGLGYVCHPEFLREGVSVKDFFNPPKIIFGVSDEHSQDLCAKLYPGIESPTHFVAPETASMIKYADNCFHALKVTFGNEIGMICRALEVDSQAVMDAFCTDTKLNISPKYLRPGFAFGGSCLPKDLRATLDVARHTATPLPMLAGVLESNRMQVERVLSRVLSPERPLVGIVGLAFKEGTDDVRESPMVTLSEQLSGKGHPVQIYDAHLSLPSLRGSNLSFALSMIPHLAEVLTSDLQRLVDEAEIVVVAHRLDPQTWQRIKWKARQRVLDLINVPELRSAPGYEGLYW